MAVRIVSATARVHVAGYGRCFPAVSTLQNRNPIRCTEMTVTGFGWEVLGSFATIYLAFQATAPQNWSQQTIQQRAIPLIPGESITFRSTSWGGGAKREMMFGTGYSYIVAAATGRRVKCTYYQWE